MKGVCLLGIEFDVSVLKFDVNSEKYCKLWKKTR